MSLTLGAAAAAAEPLSMLSPWPIDVDDPVGSLPSEYELKQSVVSTGYLLHDLEALADAAFEGGEYERAAKFYDALTRLPLNRNQPYADLCRTQELLGQHADARRSCARATIAVEPPDVAVPTAAPSPMWSTRFAWGGGGAALGACAFLLVAFVRRRSVSKSDELRGDRNLTSQGGGLAATRNLVGGPTAQEH